MCARSLAAGLSLLGVVASGTLVVTATGRASLQPAGPSVGVLVAEVQPGSPAAMAGVRAGDLLRSWRRASASESPGGLPVDGALAGASDLEAMLVDVAARALVSLDLRRGTSDVTVVLPVRTSRPGVRVDTDTPPLARADDALARGRVADASAIIEAAFAGSGTGTDTLRHAAWRLRRAAVHRQSGRLPEAAADATHALDVRQRLAGGSWDEADAHAELGRIALVQQRLGEAATHFTAAVAIVDAGAPSLEAVRHGFALADVEWRQGRLLEAERRVLALLPVASAVAPDSAEHARLHNLWGILRSQNGDLPGATRAFQTAYETHARREPDGTDVATALNNLGIAAMQRGRYAEAESYYRRSLALKERLRTSPLDRMSTLGNLGVMSIERADLDSAVAYLTQALELVRTAAPGSLQEAGVLNNLARAARLGGRASDAGDLVSASLALRARLAPGSVLHAFTLVELGKVHEAAGRLDEALQAHRQALSIRESLLPDGSSVAESLDAVGSLTARRGEVAEARRLHERAGRIWERVAPESVYDGLNLVARARLDLAGGAAGEARGLFARAVDVFDALAGSVGGAFDTQADFRERLRDVYTDYAGLLVRQGDVAEAFRISERARARVFLAMLAERDVATPDAPPAVEQTRRALAAEYDRVQAELSRLSPLRDGAKIDAQVARLRDLRLRLSAVRVEAARSVPAGAVPSTLEVADAASARAFLPAGTLAVSYLIGHERSHAFLLSSAVLTVVDIPWGREQIAAEVARFARLVSRPDSDVGQVERAGEELYRVLVGPVEPALGRHRRLLVVPDGPLHGLPFAALVRARASAGRRPAYLGSWRPLHQVPSLTVYGRLLGRQPRTDGRRLRVLAVGDPDYATANAADRLSARAPTVGLPLLPGTRHEVEALGGIYGDRATRLLGADATESRVREAMAGVDVVHLAAHGLVNARFPLDSGIALSPGDGREGNGLLQAWEVFEGLRLNARLVVLSACDTAGSRESGGEGLLGLARAFQFAGADAVVGSHWRVPDQATAELMTELHRQLRAGRAADEALSRAQANLLGSSRTAHPYFWAAFELNGRP